MTSSTTDDDDGSNGPAETERRRQQRREAESAGGRSRRSVLKSSARAAGALALGGLGFTRRSSGEPAGRSGSGPTPIPTAPTYYAVRIVGQSPNEAFDREGILLVTPPVDTTGATQVNARDVALRSGSPPSLPEAGAIWYATNTALYNAVGIPATRFPQGTAQLDVATVEADEASGLLQIRPDVNLARAAQLNVFTARTTIVASIFNVIEGVVQIQFQSGNQLAGVLDLVGVAPTGAASDQSRLVAEFAGVVATP